MSKLVHAGLIAFVLFLHSGVIVQAQGNILDGWMSCISYRDLSIGDDIPVGSLNTENYSMASSAFNPYQIAYQQISPINLNTSPNDWSNWICLPMEDGLLYLAIEADNFNRVGESGAWMTVVTPDDVVGWTMDCAWMMSRHGLTLGKIRLAMGPSGTFPGEFLLNDQDVAGGGLYAVTSLGVEGSLRQDWDDNVTTFPPTIVNATSQLGNRFNMQLEYTMGTSGQQFYSADIACSLQSVLQYENNETVEYAQPPGGWNPLWNVPDIGANNGYSPTAWTPAPSQTATFSVGDTFGAACTPIIPNFSWGPYDVFGYTLQIDIPLYEICTQPKAVSLAFLGIDFGSYILVVLSLGAIGVLYSRLK